MQNGKKRQKWKKIVKTATKRQRNYAKKNENMFPPQKNFLETLSICLPLFIPYAPMHKFCACYMKMIKKYIVIVQKKSMKIL